MHEQEDDPLGTRRGNAARNRQRIGGRSFVTLRARAAFGPSIPCKASNPKPAPLCLRSSPQRIDRLKLPTCSVRHGARALIDIKEFVRRENHATQSLPRCVLRCFVVFTRRRIIAIDKCKRSCDFRLGRPAADPPADTTLAAALQDHRAARQQFASPAVQTALPSGHCSS